VLERPVLCKHYITLLCKHYITLWYFGELKSDDEQDGNFISQSQYIRLSCPVDLNDCNLLFHACIHIFKNTHHNENS